ncbi:MAG: hypothetical protein ABEI86_06280, partial [Halobacteriaceae archaeon]
TIIHEDGSEIEVRSAGAEHVVALALMGALQNNAPLQGPIIMDSPFGRLDKGHVRNVVETLPSLTDQVMLLVYRDEINPETARELLKGKLRREYRLDRVSARHTKALKQGIEPGKTPSTETVWNVGSFDPDGEIRDLVLAMHPSIESPYDAVEHFVNQGFRLISQHLEENKELDIVEII